MVVTLDNGTEVIMQAYEIKEQLERLAMVLEHSRVTRKPIRSVNVIPKINPAVIYADTPVTTPAEAEKKNDEK